MKWTIIITYSIHLLIMDPNRLCPCTRHSPSLAILCDFSFLQISYCLFLKLVRKKTVKALGISLSLFFKLSYFVLGCS